MLKDSFLLGALSGIVGNIFKEILAWSCYLLGIIPYTVTHMVASAFHKGNINSPLSIFIGFIIDYIVASFWGIVLLFLLKKVGQDFAILKGVLFGSFLYAFFYGSFLVFGLTQVSAPNALTNLIIFFPHLLFGGVAAWFIQRSRTCTNLFINLALRIFIRHFL